MQHPDLMKQVVKLHGRLRENVDNLDVNDPLKDWFQIELATLDSASGVTELPLDEANARLKALKQLSHLVFEHCVRIQNPDYQKPIDNLPDSFLTVQARMPANVLDTARKHKFSIDPKLLHDPNRDNESFDPVSPTAKVVGFLRGLDPKLKLSAEFLVGDEGKSLLDDLDIQDQETMALMAILFQSRYHAINASIAQSNIANSQVIEFASGISPRGYQWSQMNPGTIYVESDLPQLMIHKSKLIRNALMQRDSINRGILHCCAANVLDLESMSNAIQDFDPAQPLTIVTEGLLLYFDEPEMDQFWENMRHLLSQHPNAVWVTDMVTKENLGDLMNSHPGVAEAVRKVFQLTSRTVVASNPFQGDSCIVRQLERFDLQPKSRLLLTDALSLLPLANQEMRSKAEKLVGYRKIWQISV